MARLFEALVTVGVRTDVPNHTHIVDMRHVLLQCARLLEALVAVGVMLLFGLLVMAFGW